MQYLGRTTDPKDLARQDDPQGPEANITANVTGGANSTADFELASLTVPASFTSVGMSFVAEQMSTFTKANGGMNLVLWVKVNGTKVATITLAQANAAQTSQPVYHSSRITFGAIGGTGQVSIVGRAMKGTTVQIGGASAVQTVDTGANITIAIGANMSVANAGHSLTAQFARVGMM